MASPAQALLRLLALMTLASAMCPVMLQAVVRASGTTGMTPPS
jgi:hypothetical protein